MNDINKKDNDFIGYEYSDVTVNQSMASVYIDGYHNFGWELENTSSTIGGIGSVNMKFKRNRKLRRTPEIIRLQRQFDACANEIVALQRSKSVGAATMAYIIGLMGTAFMAGSVFAVVANMIPLTIILAIPAFAGWIVPYFCYTALLKKKTAQVNPLVDQKYDEMYNVCEKANGLLAAI